MDKIFLSDLRVEAIIGIFEWERNATQTISIDLEMATDVAAAAKHDAIDDALDYKHVAKRIVAYVESSDFRLVETLAERLAEIVIREFKVPWVKLSIAKPAAIAGSRNVGVTIERDASHYG